MINSVSMNNMSMMGTRSMQRQAPPPEKDVFKVADFDSDGKVSSSELKTLTEGISEITGNSLDSDEVMSTYDADGDGGLSGEELYGLMSDQGLAPLGPNPGQDGADMKAPPPPLPQQVSSLYLANSDTDNIDQLLELLKDSGEVDGNYSALELTA